MDKFLDNMELITSTIKELEIEKKKSKKERVKKE